MSLTWLLFRRAVALFLALTGSTICSHVFFVTTLWAGSSSRTSGKKEASVFSTLREGVIVKLEPNRQLLIDLGKQDKMAVGMHVSLYRRVEVKHPITGKLIQDRFFVGIVKLKQVSRFLSLAEKQGAFSYPPTVGDFVVPATTPSGSSQTQIATVSKSTKRESLCPPCVANPHLEKLHRVWLSMHGTTLEKRVVGWVSFLKKHPNTPFHQHVRSHIRWLQQLEAAYVAPVPKQTLWVRHDPPREVLLDETVRIVTAVVATWKIRAVMLYYRPINETRYRSMQMQQQQRYYYVLNLPGYLTKTGTNLAYFVEVIDQDGTRYTGYSSADSPTVIQVTQPPAKIYSKKDRSLAYSFFEYVDFFTGSFGRDRYFKLEVDYRYLLHLPVLYSVRMGFGIFEGHANQTELMDKNPNIEVIPRGYTYGYLEGEFRFHEFFAMMLRVILGAVRQNHPDGLIQSPGAIFGVEGRARIGRELGTNLVLGFTGTTDIGIEGVVVLSINEVKNFPMSASVIVTNLPLGRDLGVRLLYQIGWRPIHWFSVDARVGWNIRNINHSGPTLGLGAVFRW